MLLTNKPRLLLRAKYRLRHLVRTQTADDESYNAVYQCEDPDGNSGVRLSKEIVKVAGNAMKINLTQLGPLILPLYEQAKVLLSILRRHLGRTDGARYVPSFKSAIHHFCIHAGGRAVLDGIEKNLRLTPEDMAHSRFCLREHGNTSSSSIWYELQHRAALRASARAQDPATCLRRLQVQQRRVDQVRWRRGHDPGSPGRAISTQREGRGRGSTLSCY